MTVSLREKTAFLRKFGAVPVYGGWRFTYKIEVVVKDEEAESAFTKQEVQADLLERIRAGLIGKAEELQTEIIKIRAQNDKLS